MVNALQRQRAVKACLLRPRFPSLFCAFRQAAARLLDGSRVMTHANHFRLPLFCLDDEVINPKRACPPLPLHLTLYFLTFSPPSAAVSPLGYRDYRGL